MPIPNRTPAPSPLLPEKTLDSIAKSSGLVARRSHKFSPGAFVFALLGSVARGASSLNHIAMNLGHFTPQAMSRQALAKRLSEKSSNFLAELVSSALAARFTKLHPALDGLPFRRVLVEDSTVLPMFKGNAGAFPNNGNGRTATAGCKLDIITDLLSGQPVAADFRAAREPDQKLASEILDHCRGGDLVLRDMGYFCIHALSDIDTRGAYWITRLPATTGLRDARGRTLREILGNSKRNRVDLLVEVGSRTPLPCRMVATRLDPQQAAANRRLRRSEARRRRKEPAKEALLRDGWCIVLTNATRDIVPARSLWPIYAQRWSIEIAFRALKQATNITRALAHRSSEHHIKALVLAAALTMALSMRAHATLRTSPESGRQPSLEKVCDALVDYVSRRNRDNLGEPFDPDHRHLAHDKRRRPTLWQSITYCLG